MTRKTDGAGERDCSGILDAAMGGLVTSQCACCDRDSGGDSGNVYIHVDVVCP